MKSVTFDPSPVRDALVLAEHFVGGDKPPNAPDGLTREQVLLAINQAIRAIDAASFDPSLYVVVPRAVLQNLTFMARTSGGWKPDAKLMAACDAAEAILTAPPLPEQPQGEPSFHPSLDILDATIRKLSAPAGDPAVRPATDLHALIMNLPCNELHAGSPNQEVQRAYGRGHRDARHAAAELASEAQASIRAAGDHAAVPAVSASVDLTKERAEYLDAQVVYTTMCELRKRLEETTGVRHTWADAPIQIAEQRVNEAKP